MFKIGLFVAVIGLLSIAGWSAAGPVDASAGYPVVIAHGGNGPGDGTGNGGDGPGDGTGNGPGDCGSLKSGAVLLLAGNGNAGSGDNNGNGPGDGTGNDGDGPADGTGNGPGSC